MAFFSKVFLLWQYELLAYSTIDEEPMALTPSTMLALGTPAPDFSLPSTNGAVVSLGSFKNDKLLVVAFICNHCPFVKHIRSQLAAAGKSYQAKGVGFVAINSNDIVAFPADNMEWMQEESKTIGYTFPYLLDEDQAIARAYDAACTPDFYLFNHERKLIYRGQFDSSRPSNSIPVTGEDLCAAVDAALHGKPVAENQRPSMGCNIKWKSGNEPH
jgi:peroxiredoxin